MKLTVALLLLCAAWAITNAEGDFYSDPKNYGFYSYHPMKIKSLSAHFHGRRDDQTMQAWDAAMHPDTTIRCSYTIGKSFLNCNGPDTHVQCRVSSNFTETTSFKRFSIGMAHNANKNESRHHFFLYPYQNATGVWLDHTMPVNDTLVIPTIYHRSAAHQTKMVDFGMGVSTNKCFKKLSALFHMPTSNYSISLLTGGEAFVFGELTIKPTKHVHVITTTTEAESSFDRN